MATLSTRKGKRRTLEIRHMQNTYGQFVTKTVKLPFTANANKTVTFDTLTEDELDELVKLLSAAIGITASFI